MLNSRANQYTGPTRGAKKCFLAAAAVGDITTTVNKGRWGGPMSSLLLLDVYDEQSIYLDVYGSNSVHGTQGICKACIGK